MMAASVIKGLVPFAVAGTDTELGELLLSRHDLSRFVELIKVKKTETQKRKARKRRTGR